MRIKLVLFLALVFVCGCIPALANATYTDSFDSPFVGCGCQVSYWNSGGLPPNPPLEHAGHGLLTGFSFANFYSPEFLEVWMQVDFTGRVSGYSESVNCDYSPCLYLWSGTIDGGNTNIAAKILTLSADGDSTYTDLSFTGRIGHGAFWGSFENCTELSPCGSGLDLFMNIDGTWSNGWKSSGLVTVFADSDGPYFTTTLTTTTVPEPGSLVILGSGLMVLAGALRRNRI